MSNEIKTYVESVGGVVGVIELSEETPFSVDRIRDWAHDHDIPLINNAYAFTSDAAAELVEDLEDEDEDAAENEESDEGD